MFALRNPWASALLVSSLALIFILTSPSHLAGAQTASAPTHVAKPAEQTIAQKIAASKELLDINTATAAQLKALPGMGDAYVQRIVAGRPYTAKNQLNTRGVIPQEEYEKIKDQIIAHRPKP